MRTVHDERHEALLQAVLAHDQAPEDPAVVRQLAECAQCRKRLADLERVVGAVQAIAAERDAVLATPRSPTQAALEPHVRATLERLRAEGHSRGAPGLPRSPRRWPWLALAAAVLLAGFFVVRSLRPHARPIDQTAGDKLVLVSPGEILGPEDAFECRYDASPGTRYGFHVEDARGVQVLPTVERGVPSWKPTVEERARIPVQFVWWVEALDPANPDLSVRSEKRSSSRSH